MNLNQRDGLRPLKRSSRPNTRWVLIKSAEMPSKGWSKRFDEPIALDDGATMRTLREAIQYLGKSVPKGR